MVSGSAHRLAEHQRRGARGLGAEHAGQPVGQPVTVVLGIALPVSGDVARVADGQRMHVGCGAERVDDLERRGLLAFDAEWVDGVDQRDGREVGGELAGQLQAVVEVAVDLDDLRAVHDRLRELAHRNLALRHQHRTRDACPRRIRRGRRRCVARRRAQHGLLTPGHRLGDGHGHAAIFERARRVEPLDLQMNCAPGVFGQPRRRHQRGAALEQRDCGPAVLDRQPIAVGGDQSWPGLVNGLGRGRAHCSSRKRLIAHSLVPSMRSTLLTLCTTSRSASAATVSDNAASVAWCVTTTMRAPHR